MTLTKLLITTIGTVTFSFSAIAGDKKGKHSHPHYGKGHHDSMKGHHKGMKSDMFKKLDLNKDKKISKDEFLAHFKSIDTNNDGSITPNEMDKHHADQAKMMHK